MVLTPGLHALGQNRWCWPEDTATAKEMVALYNDNMKAGTLTQCIEPLEWLLTNAPNLNPSIYINGIKIYDGLVSGERDDSLRTAYQEKVIQLIDRREEAFASKPQNKTRKAYYGYKYWSRTPDRYEGVFEWFVDAWEANDGDIGKNLLPALLDIVSKTQPSEAVLDWYEHLLHHVMKTPENTEMILPVLDKILLRSIPWTCADINRFWQMQVEETNWWDSKGQLLIKLGLEHDCLAEDYFKDLAIAVVQKSGNGNLLKLVARKYDTEGDWQTAAQLYEVGLAISESDSTSTELLMLLANLHSGKALFSDARRYARHAIALNPDFKPAHELIGDLYFDSYYSCKEGVSQVVDRAVFLAAYDEYGAAGNTEKMLLAKEQFPSATEIFEDLYDEGEMITVGCWINVSVPIRRRD